MSDGFPLYEKGLDAKNILQYDRVEAVFRDESLLADAQRGTASQRSVRSIWDTLIQPVRPIEGVLRFDEKNTLIDQTTELFLSTPGGVHRYFKGSIGSRTSKGSSWVSGIGLKHGRKTR